jgi:hypothetical protein
LSLASKFKLRHYPQLDLAAGALGLPIMYWNCHQLAAQTSLKTPNAQGRGNQ